jgi:hypothetical protein
MPIHWNYYSLDYMPALEGERSEMAHLTVTSELFQAGHFHDQAQIVAVFAGWRSLQRRLVLFEQRRATKGETALESLYWPLAKDATSASTSF